MLVADPGRDSREVLSQGLRAGGISQVLVAESAAQVDDLVAKGQRGQLALVSLAFGVAAARLIDNLRHGAWPRVIALAPTADPDAVVVALQAGASGVLRGHPTPIISDPEPAVRQLTEREIEVLAGVAEGRSNQWIGEQLSLSALTIKSHLARISRKLGTGDRAHMVAIAMRAGVIS
ncbi:MAG: LuxR C-terminal-related transcriptional regulator [Nakamurella sp.]